MDENGNWGTWFQGLVSNLTNTAMQQRTLETLQRGQYGYYREGQPGVYPANYQQAGMSSGTLLMLGGAALVAVLLLKD